MDWFFTKIKFIKPFVHYFLESYTLLELLILNYYDDDDTHIQLTLHIKLQKEEWIILSRKYNNHFVQVVLNPYLAKLDQFDL